MAELCTSNSNYLKSFDFGITSDWDTNVARQLTVNERNVATCWRVVQGRGLIRYSLPKHNDCTIRVGASKNFQNRWRSLVYVNTILFILHSVNIGDVKEKIKTKLKKLDTVCGVIIIIYSLRWFCYDFKT
jgi:hypothetical protein